MVEWAVWMQTVEEADLVSGSIALNEASWQNAVGNVGLDYDGSWN